MGLDSVELLFNLEEKFGKEITNLEAEQITTVNDLVEAFFKKIVISSNEECLSKLIFYKLRKAFIELGNDKNNVTPSTVLSDLMSRKDIKKQWIRIQNSLDMELPKLVKLDLDEYNNKTVKFLGINIYERSEPLTKQNVRKLVDWIISLNHRDLINTNKFNNRYEVERVVVGIISKNIGIPVNEIELYHSIIYDLGVD